MFEIGCGRCVLPQKPVHFPPMRITLTRLSILGTATALLGGVHAVSLGGRIGKEKMVVVSKSARA
jgi:hypothetical protein